MRKIGKNFFFDKEHLIKSLKIARMNVFYKDYVNNCFKISLMIDFLINVFIFFILSSIASSMESYAILLLLFITFPLGFVILAKFFIKTPDVRIVRSRKNIDAEIISAIRSLILDLKANAPLFDALMNIRKNFDEIGIYVNDVITDVRLGDSLEDALNEAVELVPSESFRVLLWQLVNHLQTGANIIHTLEQLGSEIIDKQRIEFRKYGKKLNVLSLFYMIIAIILPTIGFTLISAALIFLGFPVNTGLILGFWVVFTLMQLLFIAISGGNRPVVES